MKNGSQVFMGGMAGSLLRYIIQLYTSTSIMLWMVNIIGSFLLGSLNGYFLKTAKQANVLLTTGMLGAFTTFSTFTESWFYELQEHFLLGVLYAVTMTSACFVAAYIGYFLNRGKNTWNG